MRRRPRAGLHRDYFPMTGSPYGLYLSNFLNPIGMPCWKPPYGVAVGV